MAGRIAALGLGLIVLQVAHLAAAAPPETAPRPAPRADVGVTRASAPESALRPRERLVQVSTRPAQAEGAGVDERAFRRWIEGFKARARAQGIRADVLERAFAGVRYDADAIRRDRSQAEFTKQIWEYLDSAVSDTRVENGRAALARHRDVLARIEVRYGVEAEVVVAVWGLESAYGTHRGKTPVIAALATLAHDGRRGRFFEAELIAALKILQAGDTSPGAMTGSWAGAMGHTQFMPSSYLAYAQDFTGDGRRDIWADDPADALASTANYLARHGWTKGQPWGVEVTLPRGFDYALTGERVKKPAAEWARLGVRATRGGALPENGQVSILLPAGARGAAFAIYRNFNVIERYNPADAYVIAVGLLSDRIRGAGPLLASWPRGDRSLSRAEREEMQRRLVARGFDPGGVDGIIGPNTIAAVRGFQRAQGMVPDGYASLEVLRRLR
ncbi:MAG: lytic murein transglycosylase [Alphaproteobacteria bacterium HGW-Alphaproteobacteria-2]|nr:MAG: lytic murein transglycosylase [Alphaproteobacteria bacterium HGW-Alphaproteobacteria-2]